MSIEEVISSAAILGFRVHNLFQVMDGTWQANLRSALPNQKGNFFFEFARADNAEDALAAAIDIAKRGYAVETPVAEVTDDNWTIDDI